MIPCFRQTCKQQALAIDSAEFITIHQAFGNHADFLTISILLDALIQGKQVTFLAVRENYAHYLSVSKKMGRSIEQFGKNGKLTYYESFASDICSELPLTESSPSVYSRPPKFVIPICLNNLNKCELKVKSIFVVDAICFIEHIPEACYNLYEKGIESRCKMIFGGCTVNGKISKILRKQADVWIQLEQDVGGNGKFKIANQNNETSIMWKFTQGKFQIFLHAKI